MTGDDFLSSVRLAAEALAAKASTYVLSSLDNEGYPAMRALLAPRRRNGIITMHFSTNSSSRHVAEFVNDSRACVYIYDPDLFQGLLLKGRVAVSRDQRVLDDMWFDGDEVFYPLGRTDPDYSALLFTAQSGRWYENLATVDFTL